MRSAETVLGIIRNRGTRAYLERTLPPTLEPEPVPNG